MISSRFSTSPKSELTSQRLRYRPPTSQKRSPLTSLKSDRPLTSPKAIAPHISPNSDRHKCILLTYYLNAVY
ncbi:MAG: hypothetical protein PT120_01240 [Aphanizomenon gracile PMC649.10]|nr:hypothetical protein [Aphanizomenon gracile PMC638.10]MDM3853568.1 hypothetical protein [Aphanizomenon gracile PMC649.10]